jgi:hypothetical protein
MTFYVNPPWACALFRNNKVSTENDNNFGYEKITIVTVVDNIPLNVFIKCSPTVFVSSPTKKTQNYHYQNYCPG